MTEIDKLIEEVRDLSREGRYGDMIYLDELEPILEKYISKCEEENRWRKFSDLDEINEFPLDIIIRTTQEDNKYYYTPTYLKNKDDLETIKYIIEIESVKDHKYSDSLEWKPIT